MSKSLIQPARLDFFSSTGDPFDESQVEEIDEENLRPYERYKRRPVTLNPGSLWRKVQTKIKMRLLISKIFANTIAAASEDSNLNMFEIGDLGGKAFIESISDDDEVREDALSNQVNVSVGGGQNKLLFEQNNLPSMLSRSVTKN